MGETLIPDIGTLQLFIIQADFGLDCGDVFARKNTAPDLAPFEANWPQRVIKCDVSIA